MKTTVIKRYDFNSGDLIPVDSLYSFSSLMQTTDLFSSFFSMSPDIQVAYGVLIGIFIMIVGVAALEKTLEIDGRKYLRFGIGGMFLFSLAYVLV